MNINRYKSGGITDKFPNRLGWWERNTYSRSVDDVVVQVSVRQAYRPDIISNDIYGTPMLAWLVLQYNNIVDVNVELGRGAVLYLPQKSRVMFNILR
jgi:hypothetical protein